MDVKFNHPKYLQNVNSREFTLLFNLHHFIQLKQKNILSSSQKELLAKIQNHNFNNLDLLKTIWDYSLIAYCANVSLDSKKLNQLKNHSIAKKKYILKTFTKSFLCKRKNPSR